MNYHFKPEDWKDVDGDKILNIERQEKDLPIAQLYMKNEDGSFEEVMGSITINDEWITIASGSPFEGCLVVK